MNDPNATSPNTSPPVAGVPAAVREVWSEFYTDEEMVAMGDALVREDVVDAARRLRAYHARRRAGADPAPSPAQQSPVVEAEPECSAGPPTDHAEAVPEEWWEMPVQRRGDAQPAQPARAALADGAAESREHTGRVTQHGGVEEFEGVPEARPSEVTVSVAQAARRLVAAGYDPSRARALVADYVQDTSRQLGFPTAGWGLDQHDLDAIAAGTDPPTAQRDPHVPAQDGDRTRPHRDRPERDPVDPVDRVDPLDRARTAVADLPHPTQGVHPDDACADAVGWSDNRGQDAVYWANDPVEWICSDAEADDIDTAGDER